MAGAHQDRLKALLEQDAKKAGAGPSQEKRTKLLESNMFFAF